MSSSTVLRLKNELQTAGDLMELMDVIKQVAASQFQTLNGKRQKGGHETVSEWRTAFVEGALALIPPAQRSHPFLAQPTGDEGAARLGLVLVTSDEGFVGGLNASVVQKGLLTRGGERAELIVLGERGRRYLTDLRKEFTFFPKVGPDDHRAAEKLRDHIAEIYLTGKVSRVVVVYPRLLSFAQQDVRMSQLLPYELPPEKQATRPKPSLIETILEPSASKIIEYLVGIMLIQKIRDVFWQGALSELAARTMYLETSVQTLTERRKKLRFQYFRSKHEATDTGIRETYAGLLLKEKSVAVPSDPDRLEEKP